MVHPSIQLVTPSLSCGSSSETALLPWVLLLTGHPIADLNRLDYWFWEAAKGSVYANRPATLDDLKQEVSDYLQTVPHETYIQESCTELWSQDQRLSEPREAHIENVNYKDFA